MKSRTFAEWRGLLAIILPGGVGAFVVARTLTAYLGHDWLATLIVCAIGIALALGLVELFARLARATKLERELHALPKTPTDNTIDSASPLLSTLLRARIEQAPLPNLSEGSAAFLTGLLVMLGLLGTLLGLFQTVHGAGQALTSSTDIDALRRSLSAPIEGLTRSFGCSAAGISASAMLGLAMALVRRNEVRAMRVFYAYAAGPLRALSPTRRQLLALEQLANQGSALPEAAHAIEGVGTKLGELATQLSELQQTAHKAQQRAFSDLLASLRGEFAKAAGEVGEALHARVSPLMEQMAARSGEALVAQAGALATVARDVTRELERDAALRREQAAEAMQALRARLDEAEQARAAAHSEELASVTALATRSLHETEQRELALSQRWQELVTRFDTQLEAARSSESERLRSFDTLADSVRERDAEKLVQLDNLTSRVGAELERLSGALSTQLEQRLASERSQDERAEHALLQLTASASALEQGSARQESALAASTGLLDAAIARQNSALEQISAQQDSALAACTGLLDAAVASQSRALEQVSARQDSAFAASTGLLEAAIAHQSTALEESRARQESAFAASAALLEAAIARHSSALEEGAARQSSALEQSGARQESVLAASAGLLEAAIARQGSALEELIARVAALLPQLADAAQSGAASTLARLRENADAQAARFAELETTLSRSREQHAFGLAEQLTSHAAELEQRLEKTSAAVSEAAAIWQASSAEMQAVAELFATSVERQREASDAWLESLGEIDGAVERAGRHAASDALADQLASTQEVFARQLQFQRELFDELRSLRAGQSPSRPVNGEQDVSV
jgi:hypothetical protein